LVSQRAAGAMGHPMMKVWPSKASALSKRSVTSLEEDLSMHSLQRWYMMHGVSCF
ncbi:hypothetical protein SK128_018828, partial [Halocaridina rubra]